MASSSKPAAAAEGNPAFNMMGLPKIHTWKLPSRNWSIFWTVIGSFGATVAYDRYEKRQIIAKYKAQVAWMSDEPLQPLQMPRKINVYMGAPPGDTIHIAREHFDEYIKPILNSAALDFELVEGKMQGDIRHKVAQAIRDKKKGVDHLSELQRAARDKLEYSHDAGDIILGRHSYKEYIRGKHEGYLGPLEEPEEVTAIMNPRMPGDPIVDVADAREESSESTTDNLGPPTPKTDEEIKAEVDAIKAKIPSSPPSYIKPAEYGDAAAPDIEAPILFTYVPMQHLLGFLNTPWRIYRFLNRRKLAEEICASTTAAVLATTTRPFDALHDVHLGRDEELDWPKRNREKPDGVWVESIVLDPRVSERFAVYGQHSGSNATPDAAMGK